LNGKSGIHSAKISEFGLTVPGDLHEEVEARSLHEKLAVAPYFDERVKIVWRRAVERQVREIFQKQVAQRIRNLVLLFPEAFQVFRVFEKYLLSGEDGPQILFVDIFFVEA
jgi:hypothetical protein